MLVFVYHCFDRIVINGFLSGLSRLELVVHFFHQVLGIDCITKETLAKQTSEYRSWVELYARNQGIPMEWAQLKVHKDDYVQSWQRHHAEKVDGCQPAYCPNLNRRKINGG